MGKLNWNYASGIWMADAFDGTHYSIRVCQDGQFCSIHIELAAHFHGALSLAQERCQIHEDERIRVRHKTAGELAAERLVRVVGDDVSVQSSSGNFTAAPLHSLDAKLVTVKKVLAAIIDAERAAERAEILEMASIATNMSWLIKWIRERKA